MAKDERLYARFDIAMDEHPKIMLLSDAAFRALHEATYYSRRQLTDGFLDERVALRKWRAEVIEELSSNHPERPSWIRVEGGWEIRDYADHQTTTADIEAKRQAGRKGGLAKAKQNASKPVAPASDVPLAESWQTSTAPLAITETETEKQKDKEIVQGKPARSLESEFSEWWELYPRKQGKADALKAFKTIRKKVAFKTLLDGVRAFALLSLGEDKSFLKLPGGWLRGERWEDEQIVNATRTTTTNQPAMCRIHDGYPMPCDSCERDRDEGREF